MVTAQGNSEPGALLLKMNCVNSSYVEGIWLLRSNFTMLRAMLGAMLGAVLRAMLGAMLGALLGALLGAML
jgi:hypothetical protein